MLFFAWWTDTLGPRAAGSFGALANCRLLPNKLVTGAHRLVPLGRSWYSDLAMAVDEVGGKEHLEDVSMNAEEWSSSITQLRELGFDQ